jgi:hypothetical protein
MYQIHKALNSFNMFLFFLLTVFFGCVVFLLIDGFAYDIVNLPAHNNDCIMSNSNIAHLFHNITRIIAFKSFVFFSF